MPLHGPFTLPDPSLVAPQCRCGCTVPSGLHMAPLSPPWVTMHITRRCDCLLASLSPGNPSVSLPFLQEVFPDSSSPQGHPPSLSSVAQNSLDVPFSIPSGLVVFGSLMRISLATPRSQRQSPSAALLSNFVPGSALSVHPPDASEVSIMTATLQTRRLHLGRARGWDHVGERGREPGPVGLPSLCSARANRLGPRMTLGVARA